MEVSASLGITLTPAQLSRPPASLGESNRTSPTAGLQQSDRDRRVDLFTGVRYRRRLSFSGVTLQGIEHFKSYWNP